MQGEASTRLGFTDYFRVELAWAKLLGAVLLLAPVPARLKESCGFSAAFGVLMRAEAGDGIRRGHFLILEFVAFGTTNIRTL